MLFQIVPHGMMLKAAAKAVKPSTDAGMHVVSACPEAPGLVHPRVWQLCALAPECYIARAWPLDPIFG